MPYGERELEEVAEDIMNEADEDMSVDDLTRGTEVYEEVDDEVEEDFEADPEELDLEPKDDFSPGGYDFGATSDPYIAEDEY